VGVAFELERVDLGRHVLAADGSDFRRVSPRGYVPLLELDDGSRHTEGAALLQYVADLDPAQALIGAVGTRRRLEVTGWLAFVASELHKAFSPWLWRKETPAETRRAVLDRLAVRFAELDGVLSTREWLAGDYSVADAYGFAIVSWARMLQLPLEPYPKMLAWLDRVAARPRALEALRAEGLRD
jgi:glutathione S-transferase